MDDVVAWLLDSDPALRWQVLDDLADATPGEVARERARVAHEGWGARLLAAQDPDGRWGGGTFFPEWVSTEATLRLLRTFGLDPESPQAHRALAPVHEAARWEYDPTLRFFDGEVEPCINGRTVATGAYFGQDVRGVVDRLLGEQMADGGWNCEQENGSTRGSFDTTINVLEGLAEYEQRVSADPAVTEARVRGEEYLLDRHLLRRLSDGRVGQERWQHLAFPHGWYYDVGRALDHLRRTRPAPDERAAEALDLLASKRGDDGRWRLEQRHHDRLLVDLGEDEGAPSRWLTLLALRVLRWADGSVADAPGSAAPGGADAPGATPRTATEPSRTSAPEDA
ncbi:hypothetical protein [Cellulomonas wangleii]|uniref:hypothetical protein n=1 Tax=Cellulomonas wangleii TaxID=2816956 RepID=UPI0020BE4A8C|nr:hypothetical protein [Cellulomonas wangleii]